MGEPTVKPLPAMPMVIDYARSPLKSDWLDVLLMAECEFLLGCNSGFSQLAHLFNKRALWTNSIPIEMCPWDDLALWIPKLIFSRPEGRMLTFPEIVARGIGQYHRAPQYAAAGLHPQENSPADILAATQELHRWVRGEEPSTDEQRAQAAFNQLFPSSYNAFGTRSRICASFVLAHRNLMPVECFTTPRTPTEEPHGAIATTVR
jgi:putative glycosyltransferase (TIGR04372 family)